MYGTRRPKDPGDRKSRNRAAASRSREKEKQRITEAELNVERLLDLKESLAQSLAELRAEIGPAPDFWPYGRPPDAEHSAGGRLGLWVDGAGIRAGDPMPTGAVGAVGEVVDATDVPGTHLPTRELPAPLDGHGALFLDELNRDLDVSSSEGAFRGCEEDGLAALHEMDWDVGTSRSAAW